MENEYNQSEVAYQNSPKEVNYKREMPKSKQFPGDKMPQSSGSNRIESISIKNNWRHKEYR